MDAALVMCDDDDGSGRVCDRLLVRIAMTMMIMMMMMFVECNRWFGS